MKRKSTRTPCFLRASLVLAIMGNETYLRAGESEMVAKMRAICTSEHDMPDELPRVFESVRQAGEEGRSALLSFVRARSAEARCGMHYLVALDDARVLPLVRDILGDASASVGLKEEALHGVAHFKDDRARALVRNAFASGASELQAPAAFALAALHDTVGLAAVRDALYGANRFALVTAVGFKGYEDAVEPLLAMAADPLIKKSNALRMDIALSLARIGSPRSRSAAVELLDRFDDRWSQERLAEDLFSAFVGQRRSPTNATDLDDIDHNLGKIRRHPGAPLWIKNR